MGGKSLKDFFEDGNSCSMGVRRRWNQLTSGGFCGEKNPWILNNFQLKLEIVYSQGFGISMLLESMSY